MPSDFPYPGRYTFVDVEIPNLNNDCICAIAMIVIEDHHEVLRHAELINPKTFFSANNIKIHGIHRKDVLESRTLEEFWKEYGQYFSKDYIIGAHNAMSDISVLNKDLARIGRKIEAERMVDTMDIMSQFYYQGKQKKGDLKLCNIAEHLQIPISHHDPESDVNACYEIVRKMAIEKEMDIEPFIRRIPHHPLRPAKTAAKPTANQMRVYLAYTRRLITQKDPRILVPRQIAIARGDAAFKAMDYEAIVLWYELAAARKTTHLPVYLRLSDLYESLHMAYDSERVLEKGIQTLRRAGRDYKALAIALRRRRRKKGGNSALHDGQDSESPTGPEKNAVSSRTDSTVSLSANNQTGSFGNPSGQ